MEIFDELTTPKTLYVHDIRRAKTKAPSGHPIMVAQCAHVVDGKIVDHWEEQVVYRRGSSDAARRHLQKKLDEHRKEHK